MRSIRNRLIASMFTLIVALTIVLSAILIRQTATGVVDGQIASLQRSGVMLTDRVALNMTLGNPGIIQRELDTVRALDEMISARITDTGGKIVAVAGTPPPVWTAETAGSAGIGRGILGEALARIFMDQTLSATTMVRDGDVALGTLTLFVDTAALRTQMIRVIALAAAAGVMTGIVAVLAAIWLQSMITRPLHQVTVAMDIAGRTGRYTDTIPENGLDETAVIARTFNAMIMRIGVRDKALKDRKADLETKVLSRTMDLERAKEVAETANRAKSAFLATMSHEIRTPLNGMMVMAELLARSDLDPKRKRYAELIDSSGRVLFNIINDILDLSKIEAGAMTIEIVPVNPRRTLSDVLDIFAEKAASKGLELAGYVDPAVPEWIGADPVRLKQILSNFVSNAIKFTEKGYVYAEVNREDDRLVMSVQDTGIGIRPENSERVFEPFAQEDNSTLREFGGTGLGLSICKRLANVMDGHVGFESEPGNGSVFFVNLPCEERYAAEGVKLVGLEALNDAVIGVIDGERIGLKVLAQSLTDAGLDIRSLDDNVEDVATLADVDLIIAAPDGMTSLVEHLSPDDAQAIRDKLVCAGPPSDSRRDWLRKNGHVREVLDLPAGRENVIRDLAAIRDPESARAFDLARAPSVIPSPGVRALVTDDNAVNREVMAAILDQLQVRAVFAEDGAEAVEAFQSDRFDVVFMDISMPVMDGIEAAKRIRMVERQRGSDRSLIVALTAHGATMDDKTWESRGFDAYLGKPVRVTDIESTLVRFGLSETVGTVGDGSENESRDGSPASSRYVDWSTMNNLTQTMDAAQRENLMETVLNVYCMDAPERLESMQTAMEDGDAVLLREAAHALKSVSLNVGANEVARIASSVEEKARSGDISVDPSTFSTLSNALKATISEFVNRPRSVA